MQCHFFTELEDLSEERERKRMLMEAEIEEKRRDKEQKHERMQMMMMGFMQQIMSGPYRPGPLSSPPYHFTPPLTAVYSFSQSDNFPPAPPSYSAQNE